MTVEGGMEAEDYKGVERRSFNRIIYNPKERPNIKIDDQVFEVADISEKGLRLINDKRIKLDIKIQGTLSFRPMAEKAKACLCF